MNCCICGPVKNCGLFLDKVFENIEKVGSLFNNYIILIYYDNSSDNTLDKLKEYKQKNNKLTFYVNKTPISKYRTHNISIGRNFCLNYIIKNKEKYPFFIMMDFDDVNCKNINLDVLNKYLNRKDWDGLSFNTSPKYYDIWGLSIYPYCFSYNHFKNNVENYTIIQNYIIDKLNKLPNGKLLQCISSFNGFSIYRTNKFLNTYYDGKVRIDLLPNHLLKAHKNASNSNVIYHNYGNVNGLYEDCEHRAFHIQAAKNSNAKIRISKEVLFN